MRIVKLPILLFATSAALLFTAAARAQQITCVEPANCSLKAASDTSTQFVTVRVVGTDKLPLGATVKFELTKGSGRVTAPEVRTDANGLATTRWIPSGIGGYPAEIRVSATTVNGEVGNQTIQLAFSRPVTSALVVSAVSSGNDQWWYEKRQLRNPVRVEIRGPTSATACEEAAVVFRSVGGGTVAPDTANGRWVTGSAERCVAESWWRLPEGVGTHALRATLGNGSNVAFRGHARALPRIVIGVAADMTHSFTERRTSADTIQVTRELPGQNTSITYDSLVTRSSVDTTQAKFTFTPAVGVEFPLHPRWQRARGSLLTTLKNPENNLFMGLSVLQAFRGVPQEAVGFDFHLMLHIQRLKTLEDPEECGRNSSRCDTDSVLRYGVGIVGITDGGSLISNLMTVFGIK